jgi:hypothetical protein
VVLGVLVGVVDVVGTDVDGAGVGGAVLAGAGACAPGAGDWVVGTAGSPAAAGAGAAGVGSDTVGRGPAEGGGAGTAAVVAGVLVPAFAGSSVRLSSAVTLPNPTTSARTHATGTTTAPRTRAWRTERRRAVRAEYEAGTDAGTGVSCPRSRSATAPGSVGSSTDAGPCARTATLPAFRNGLVA